MRVKYYKTIRKKADNELDLRFKYIKKEMAQKFGNLEKFASVEKSYSLEGEDRIALSLLRNVDASDFPIYNIDIGANHPTHGNNTRLFYDLGYKGICIDPLEELEEKYLTTRERDIFFMQRNWCKKREQLLHHLRRQYCLFMT